MAEERVQRKLTTILAADVEGYTRLVRADEEATVKTLGEYRDIIDGLIVRHDGRVFSTGGDSVLAEFSSAVEAIRCAISWQEEIAGRNAELADDRQLKFRIGINVGDVMVRDNDLFGDGVNVAARLEGLAQPGGICVSSSVFDQIKHKLSLGFEDIGPQEVKNIAEPISAYRLVPGPVSVAPSPQASGSATRWRMPAIAAAAVVIIAGAAMWNFYLRETAPAPVATAMKNLSVVVLPFDNRSGDPEQDYFVDGITEDLITDLSRIRGAFVIARGTSFTYKGKAVNAKDVAKELGIRYVLEGSVRQVGNTVRVNAQLIDGHTGAHIWSDLFDRAKKDAFTLQNEVTGRIASVLRLELLSAESNRLAQGPPANLEAWDYALRGMAELWTKPVGKESALRAKLLFDKALALDSALALGWTGMARVYYMQPFYHWGEMKKSEALASGLKAARKAIALDPKSAEAHTQLGMIFGAQGDRNAAAETACKTALELNRNHEPAYTCLAMHKLWTGRPAEAMPFWNASLRLSPRLPTSARRYFFIGWSHLSAKNYEEAVKSAKKAVVVNPTLHGSYWVLASALAWLGRTDEAKPALAEYRRLRPHVSTIEKMRGFYSHRFPNFEHVLEGLRKAGMQEADAPRLSIVVLPFDNLSGDAKQDYFADGITEDLISDLSRIRGAFVIARGTSFTYKGKAVNAKEVARDLKVRYVLEGSVRRSGNQVRVNAQLIDGATGSHVWSDRFDRTFKDVFSLQNDITGRLAARLKFELLETESRQKQQGAPGNHAAWDYALQGFVKVNMSPRTDSRAHLDAKSLLEKAIELDSDLAIAWTGLASFYYTASTIGVRGISRLKSRKQLFATAERAVALDPKSADAHTVLGMAYRLNRKPAPALASCERALSLNPNSDEANTCAGLAKLALGHTAEAVPLLHKSLRLNPSRNSYRLHHFLGLAHLIAGKHEKAETESRKALAENPKFSSPYFALASTLAWLGRVDEARTVAAHFMKVDKNRGTIERIRQRMGYMSPNFDHVLEGLRRAGMPEK